MIVSEKDRAEHSIDQTIERRLYTGVMVEGSRLDIVSEAWEMPQEIVLKHCRAHRERRMAAPPSRFSPRQWLQDARQLAIERMEFLYGEAVRAWDSSQRLADTQRRSCGDVRYLEVAARINTRLMDMQVRSLTAIELLDAKLRQMLGEEEACLEEHPPVRDCSCSKPPVEGGGEQAAQDVAAKCSSNGDCDDLTEARRELLAGLDSSLDPVQDDDQGGVREMIAEVAAKRDLFPPRLNRKQRRARQRRLEKLRRKQRA